MVGENSFFVENYEANVIVDYLDDNLYALLPDLANDIISNLTNQGLDDDYVKIMKQCFLYYRQCNGDQPKLCYYQNKCPQTSDDQWNVFCSVFTCNFDNKKPKNIPLSIIKKKIISQLKI